MARASLVSCINLFGVTQLHIFSVELGAHQIINWCAPIIHLNYLVRAKSFGAHRLISYISWTRMTCDTVAPRGIIKETFSYQKVNIKDI